MGDEGRGSTPQGPGISRRQFVRIAGSSLALATLPACRRPVEMILPYVRQPPELVPGRPVWYATAMPLDGFGTGLLVETREGRPIKIEGNPGHPASVGATGAIEQGSILDLYDADRARVTRRGGREAPWRETAAALAPEALASRIGARGAGLHLLLEPTTSPTAAHLLDRLREHYPDMGLHFHAPLGRPAGPAGLERHADFAATDVILSVNADPLGSGPGYLRRARDFATRRDPEHGMNRLYALESALTVTGAAADHRIPIRPADAAPLLGALLAFLDGAADHGGPSWLEEIGRDLASHHGAALVVAGDGEPDAVHRLAERINLRLGATGRIRWYTRSPVYAASEPASDLTSLVDAIAGNAVRMLISIGVNACYAAPGDLQFAERYRRVPERIHAASGEDETAGLSEWFVPLSHYLESWGDIRAVDGTASIIQPLIRPLYPSVTPLGLLAALLGETRSDHALVRDTWQAGSGNAGEEAWAAALENGVWPRSASVRMEPPPDDTSLVVHPPSGSPREEIDLVVTADAGVHDGRFANNAWLQELPRPPTTLTWGNAAQLSPATAERLGVSDGAMLRLERDGRSAALPALVVPGVADGVVVVALGFGRRAGGRLAPGIGTDIYPIWAGARTRTVVTVSAAGGTGALALTQGHWSMEDRDPARVLSLEEARALPPASHVPPATLHTLPVLPPRADDLPQWAMTIDLSRCTGCSACVIACQAENNIPSVGREGVLDRREMHWIRIDHYLPADPGRGARVAQPMLCQHCEKAPCEYVCPVEATTHSADGLNEMTYNRCVGTRFCSNNCPYKVRRFNWFDYNADLAEPEQLAKNPHVTVRGRGVMEKCTFCVQRIREAEIEARATNQPLAEGGVRTACQQVCPSEAIRFGSLSGEEEAVVRERASRRAYDVLEELGTRPRVRYLARVVNPNPAMGRAG